MSLPGPLEHAGRRLLQTFFGYESQWVDTSVGKLHVLAREGGGRLPPIVLFHGFGSAAMYWVPLLRELRPHVERVVALDLPGHGFSDRPDPLTHEVLRDGVVEAMDQVALGPAVVVGNSLGGVTALRYTHARPERVLGAVLLSPGGAPMTAEELDELRAIFRIDSHAGARTFLDRLHAKPSALRGRLFAPTVLRTFSDAALTRWFASISERDFLDPSEVSGVPRPTKLLWGRQERILPSGQLAFWRAHLPPGSPIVEPEGMGHVPQLDAARRTADEILSFARGL